jgi:formate hydrogenlyase subunit 4
MSGLSGAPAEAGVSVLQLAASGVGGPLLYGLMAKVRARAEGRAGAPVWQPLAELRRLMGKERVHAEHSSAVLPLAPLALTASAATAAAIPWKRGHFPLADSCHFGRFPDYRTPVHL